MHGWKEELERETPRWPGEVERADHQHMVERLRRELEESRRQLVEMQSAAAREEAARLARTKVFGFCRVDLSGQMRLRDATGRGAGADFVWMHMAPYDGNFKQAEIDCLDIPNILCLRSMTPGRDPRLDEAIQHYLHSEAPPRVDPKVNASLTPTIDRSPRLALHSLWRARPDSCSGSRCAGTTPRRCRPGFSLRLTPASPAPPPRSPSSCPTPPSSFSIRSRTSGSTPATKASSCARSGRRGRFA